MGGGLESDDFAELVVRELAELCLSTKKPDFCAAPMSVNPRGRVGGRDGILELIPDVVPEEVDDDGCRALLPLRAVSERFVSSFPWKPLAMGGTGDNGTGDSGA